MNVEDTQNTHDLRLGHATVRRGTVEQRRAVAAANGWDQRVASLDAWLKDLVKTGSGGR